MGGRAIMNGPAPEHIGKDNSGTTGTQETRLMVSDWVTFLSSEKQGTLSNLVSALAVALAAIAVAYAISTTWSERLIASIFALVIVLGPVYFGIYKPQRKRYRHAEKILDDIMSGTLTQPEQIQSRWNCGKLPKEHEGEYWLGGALLAGAFWFAGWLFTIAFADLALSKIILGLVVWPYYLGVAIR
jgi:hypothetical protein